MHSHVSTHLATPVWYRPRLAGQSIVQAEPNTLLAQPPSTHLTVQLCHLIFVVMQNKFYFVPSMVAFISVVNLQDIIIRSEVGCWWPDEHGARAEK